MQTGMGGKCHPWLSPGAQCTDAKSSRFGRQCSSPRTDPSETKAEIRPNFQWHHTQHPLKFKMTAAQLCMVIFLNKIVFLLPVKDSLLPTNLCQESQSQLRPVSAAKVARFILETMKQLGAAALEGLWRSWTCRRLICMIITIMDPPWCQPPHLTKCQYNFNSSQEAQARAVAPTLQN